jgi:histidinol-phosphate aminotransferase
MDVEALLAPHVREMQPYSPIVPLDVLSKRLGIAPETLVKLDANENPYGASPRALEALARSRELHLYPDPDQTALREAISAFIDVPAAHVLCGAGADEIIDLLTRSFVLPGDTIFDLPPTFGMYKWETDLLAARYVAIPRRADFSVDVAAVERAVERAPGASEPGGVGSSPSRPKILFVANPNNPDGSVTARADLLRLLDLPVVVVVDEAYIDFSGEQSLAPLVRERDNLIVLRTFSKLAGLAGLRVGYGVFPLPVIQHLWKVKQPYTPNVAGTVAAIAALGDREWLHQHTTAIVAERERLAVRLGELGWLTPLPSQTNFLLCRVDEGRDARAIKQALERHGVLVRYFDREGLRDCIRISVGRPEHTDALLAALRASA